MHIKTIDHLVLNGKRVFIRAGFNVPIGKNGEVQDDSRIRQAVPTIQHAMDQGAKVLLASHLGRPKGKPDSSLSLKPVARRLEDLLQQKVGLAPDCVGPDVEDRVKQLAAGDVLLLENLRFHSREEENDSTFSQSLASLADIYINDAFSASHRNHASIVGITKHIAVKGIGFVMKKELEALSPLLENPEKPFAVILGGAKVKTKIGVIKGLMSRVDMILLGGAMAYTVQQAYGISTGKSPVEQDLLQEVKALCEQAKQQGVMLLLPKDHVVAPEKTQNTLTSTTSGRDIPEDRLGLDIGAQTIEMFQKELRNVRTVFWNGPLGVTEISPFEQGTNAVAETIIEHVPYSVIGGGDTVAALARAGLAGKFRHCSTGGGASLEFLANGDLPGLKALREE
jgi:phosphoglycerate kinase